VPYVPSGIFEDESENEVESNVLRFFMLWNIVVGIQPVNYSMAQKLFSIIIVYTTF